LKLGRIEMEVSEGISKMEVMVSCNATTRNLVEDERGRNLGSRKGTMKERRFLLPELVCTRD
jgi:hypothetical protein